MSGSYRLIFLGTSSALPTVQRQQSSIAFQTPSCTFILDAGEGLQVQLQKFKVKIKKQLRVLITHFHSDHTIGLIGLLSSLELQGNKKPVTIYGPKYLSIYLHNIMHTFFIKPSYPLYLIELKENHGSIELEEFILEWFPTKHFEPSIGFIIREKSIRGEFNALKAEELGIPFGPERQQLLKGEPLNLHGKIIYPHDVILPPTRNPLSIAYTGDTMYSEEVISAVKGVDILIHEGTYPSNIHELNPRYLEYRHSTVIDAARVASQAKVKQLILTHFSTRIQDFEREKEKVNDVFARSIFAFDGLEIHLPCELPIDQQEYLR